MPTRVDRHEVRPVEKPPPEVRGTRRLSKSRTAPDRTKVAYLDAEDPNGPLLLFCLCGQQWQATKAQPLSRKPILDFQWAQNSESFWIITVDGADEPIGCMSLQGRFEKLVDPYSSWRNRFLNIPVLGNYFLVKHGFAVFFPNHRAPHTFPTASFGEAYVGESKDRDPIDVLVDDVMTGVKELIRRGIADPDRLFLYSSSNGASAINQLLTETEVFRAAISHAGVADWLEYYQQNRSKGDETIPSFLGGRKPEDSPQLYFRISPINHVERIKTPLLLIVGSKDSRYADTMKFAIR
jgi:hypothetical protein